MVVAHADVPFSGCRGAPGLGSTVTHRRRDARILKRLKRKKLLWDDWFTQAAIVLEKLEDMGLMQLGADGSTVGEGERAGCLACDTCPIALSDAPLTRDIAVQVDGLILCLEDKAVQVDTGTNSLAGSLDHRSLMHGTDILAVRGTNSLAKKFTDPLECESREILMVNAGDLETQAQEALVHETDILPTQINILAGADALLLETGNMIGIGTNSLAEKILIFWNVIARKS